MSHRDWMAATNATRHRMSCVAMLSLGLAFALSAPAPAPAQAPAQAPAEAALQPGAAHPIVLHAARLLEIDTGRMVSPGEILIEGERIAAVGSAVSHPADAQFMDLGDSTLLPGLIDAHVHLFLHPGAEDLQRVEESVAQRTILAMLAAKDDLMAEFTAERDMGTEGAGSADSAVRDAINTGLI